MSARDNLRSNLQAVPLGPSGYPFVGSLFHLASHKRMDWLQSSVDKYGDVIAFRLLKKRAYFINHPELVKDVLTRSSENYSKKTISFKIVKEVLGESTFTSVGDEWKRKRSLVQPYFHKGQIAGLGTLMTDCIEEMLDQWESECDAGRVIELTEAMMQVTLKVVVKALFSTALSHEDLQIVGASFPPLLTATNRRAALPFQLLNKLPLASNKNYRGYIEDLDQIIFRIIHERRASKETPTDLLQMLMDATDKETGQPLSDDELRNEAMTMFIAGHETTANAMSWLFAIVAQRPDVRLNIEREIDSVLGKRKPTSADFSDLDYCLKAFRETMRLYPPVPMLPRRVETEHNLGGYYIEGGSDLFFSPYLLHRHRDFWHNPEFFDPQRFTKEAQRAQHSYAYIPFGGGPRVCLGNNFALMEAVFIIAMITQKFRLTLTNKGKIEALMSLTMRPKYGVPIRLEKR